MHPTYVFGINKLYQLTERYLYDPRIRAGQAIYHWKIRNVNRNNLIQDTSIKNILKCVRTCLINNLNLPSYEGPVALLSPHKEKENFCYIMYHVIQSVKVDQKYAASSAKYFL